MKKCTLILMLTAALGLLGCGGGGGGSGICSALGKCGAAPADCELYFDALILPGGCEEAVIAATCEDHRSETPSYMDLCFPPCGADSAVCTGDIIAVCYSARTTTLNCAQVCQLNDMTYTGVCDNEYQGVPSADGQDDCWCE
jgi:hypothetical protein